MHVSVQEHGDHVHAGEDQREAAEEPMQVKEPGRAGLAAHDVGGQGKAPDH